MENENKSQSATEEEVKEYNREHGRWEKLARMYTGCGSSLVAYHERELEIEVRLTKRIAQDPQKRTNVIHSLIHSWYHHIKAAEEHFVHLYIFAEGGGMGFTLAVPEEGGFTDGKPAEDFVSSLADAIRSLKQAEECPDIKIGEVRGIRCSVEDGMTWASGSNSSEGGEPS